MAKNEYSAAAELIEAKAKKHPDAMREALEVLAGRRGVDPKARTELAQSIYDALGADYIVSERRRAVTWGRRPERKSSTDTRALRTIAKGMRKLADRIDELSKLARRETDQETDEADDLRIRAEAYEEAAKRISKRFNGEPPDYTKRAIARATVALLWKWRPNVSRTGQDALKLWQALYELGTGNAAPITGGDWFLERAAKLWSRRLARQEPRQAHPKLTAPGRG